MKTAILGFMAIVALTSVAHAEQGTPARVSPSDAKNHRGETATVCGHPTGFVCRSDGTAFILSAVSGSEFRIFIPKAARRQFGPRLEDRFGQRNVCATGPIEAIGTGSQIVVTVLDAPGASKGRRCVA